jgi:hypothetical protein
MVAHVHRPRHEVARQQLLGRCARQCLLQHSTLCRDLLHRHGRCRRRYQCRCATCACRRRIGSTTTTSTSTSTSSNTVNRSSRTTLLHATHRSSHSTSQSKARANDCVFYTPYRGGWTVRVGCPTDFSGCPTEEPERRQLRVGCPTGGGALARDALTSASCGRRLAGRFAERGDQCCPQGAGAADSL